MADTKQQAQEKLREAAKYFLKPFAERGLTISIKEIEQFAAELDRILGYSELRADKERLETEIFEASREKTGGECG